MQQVGVNILQGQMDVQEQVLEYQFVRPSLHAMNIN